MSVDVELGSRQNKHLKNSCLCFDLIMIKLLEMIIQLFFWHERAAFQSFGVLAVDWH